MKFLGRVLGFEGDRKMDGGRGDFYNTIPEILIKSYIAFILGSKMCVYL